MSCQMRHVSDTTVSDQFATLIGDTRMKIQYNNEDNSCDAGIFSARNKGNVIITEF